VPEREHGVYRPWISARETRTESARDEEKEKYHGPPFKKNPSVAISRRHRTTRDRGLSIPAVHPRKRTLSSSGGQGPQRTGRGGKSSAKGNFLGDIEGGGVVIAPLPAGRRKRPCDGEGCWEALAISLVGGRIGRRPKRPFLGQPTSSRLCHWAPRQKGISARRDNVRRVPCEGGHAKSRSKLRRRPREKIIRGPEKEEASFRKKASRREGRQIGKVSSGTKAGTALTVRSSEPIESDFGVLVYVRHSDPKVL